MTGTRRIASLLVFVLLTLIIAAAPAGPAGATPLSEKRQELEEIGARLGKVYREASIAVEKYNEATAQLAAVKAAMKQNKRLLAVAEYNLELANAQLETRAVNLYKQHDISVVDVLFATSSFEELVTHLELMERLGNSDVDTVKSIDAYKRDIKDRRLKLEADEKEADRLVTERAAQKDEVLALQSRLERMQSDLEREISRLRAAARAAAAAAAAEAAQQAALVSETTSYEPPDPGGSGNSSVVAIAQRYLGVPYVWGGASPAGFDCSGLTMYCYAQVGVSLPHGATLQQKMSTPVPIHALQPGDLVFFGSASYSYHVGIYSGGGQMIHAPHTGAVVSYGSISGAWIGGRF
jgi:cell wall-associated NlpC family hydrolase